MKRTLVIVTLIVAVAAAGGAGACYLSTRSRAQWLQTTMQIPPGTQFVAFAQAILSRSAGIETVWPRFLATFGMGMLFFGVALARLRTFLAARQ